MRGQRRITKVEQGLTRLAVIDQTRFPLIHLQARQGIFHSSYRRNHYARGDWTASSSWKWSVLAKRLRSQALNSPRAYRALSRLTTTPEGPFSRTDLLSTWFPLE